MSKGFYGLLSIIKMECHHLFPARRWAPSAGMPVVVGRFVQVGLGMTVVVLGMIPVEPGMTAAGQSFVGILRFVQGLERYILLRIVLRLAVRRRLRAPR